MGILEAFKKRRDSVIKSYDDLTNKYLDEHGNYINDLDKLLTEYGLEIIGVSDNSSLIDCLDIHQMKYVYLGRIKDKDLQLRIIFRCNYNISLVTKLPYISLSNEYIKVSDDYNFSIIPDWSELHKGINEMYQVTKYIYECPIPREQISNADKYKLYVEHYITYINTVCDTFYKAYNQYFINKQYDDDIFKNWNDEIHTAYKLYLNDAHVIKTMIDLKNSN